MTEKRISTRQYIINKASDLFMNKGFQATSTRMIAESAGITQPNLYHHFKTKEDIYIAVMEDLSQEIKQGLQDIILKEDTNLVSILQRIMDYLREKHPVNFSIMNHDMTHEISEENHQYLYTIWREYYLQPLIYLFDKYLANGSPLTSNELARHFYASISPFIQKDNRFYKELSSEKIIDLFVYGILDRNQNNHL